MSNLVTLLFNLSSLERFGWSTNSLREYCRLALCGQMTRMRISMLTSQRKSLNISLIPTRRSKKLPNSSAINALNVEEYFTFFSLLLGAGINNCSIVACADAWRCEKYTGCKWQNFDRVYHRFSKQVPCDALSMLCHWPCVCYHAHTLNFAN